MLLDRPFSTALDSCIQQAPQLGHGAGCRRAGLFTRFRVACTDLPAHSQHPSACQGALGLNVDVVLRAFRLGISPPGIARIEALGPMNHGIRQLTWPSGCGTDDRLPDPMNQ